MQAGPPPDKIKEREQPAPRQLKKPPVRRRSLENDIGQLLVTANLFAAPFVGPKDVLDDIEVVALAKALDEQCQRSAAFRRYVERAIEAAGGTGIIAVVVMIAGRRAARHGLLEPSWDNRLAAFLRMSSIDIDPNDPEAAAQMAAAMMGPSNVEPETNGQSPG